MTNELFKLTFIVAGLAAVTLIGLLSAGATAQQRPQEVLDLIAEHQALAMKIRPLQDRIAVAGKQNEDSASFNPDGVPLRAKGSSATSDAGRGAEGRVAENLRHKDRAVAPGDDYSRIRARLTALEKKAMAERERVNRPDFGAGLRSGQSGSANVRFGDGRRGARLPAAAKPAENAGAAAAANVDATEIAAAHRALASLQREFAELEREANALQRN